jgi:hypothetical protein
MDRDHNTFQILHHIVVGEPKHPVSAGCKPCIASFIVANTRFEIVTFAIDLNDKLARVRDEVSDVIAHGALSAKSESCEPACLRMAPQYGFGARHFPS